MLTIGLRELNQNPSRAVAQVRQTGEPVVITDRGKPVVRLIPESAETPSSFLQRLVEAGEVRPPISRWTPSELPDPAPGVESLTDILLADRAKERNRVI